MAPALLASFIYLAFKRQALFVRLLANFYEIGKAVHYASATELDAVINPAETRRWLQNALGAAPVRKDTAQRRFVDTC